MTLTLSEVKVLKYADSKCSIAAEPERHRRSIAIDPVHRDNDGEGNEATEHDDENETRYP